MSVYLIDFIYTIVKIFLDEIGSVCLPSHSS